MTAVTIHKKLWASYQRRLVRSGVHTFLGESPRECLDFAFGLAREWQGLGNSAYEAHLERFDIRPVEVAPGTFRLSVLAP